MSPAPTHSPQEQEDIILDAAAKCIENSSLLDFTMSAISKEACLSMGSIYKHIQFKEDVLVALAYRMYMNLLSVFQEIQALPLPIPERLMATNLVSKEKVFLYSFDAQLGSLVNSKAVLQRASKGWIEKMIRADKAVEESFASIIREAYETGELQSTTDDAERLIEEINVGLWSMCVGFTQVAVQLDARSVLGNSIGGETLLSMEPGSPFINNVQRLLNSYPWKNNVTDTDLKRICNTLKKKGLR